MLKIKSNTKKHKEIIIILICIVAISLFFIFKISKEDKIVKLVDDNQEFLNKCVENNMYNKIYEIEEVKDITPYYLKDGEIYIDFYCYGFGIVPSSIYYGFYYVSKDQPLGFQAAPIKLEADGKGWKWEEDNGDNWYYTMKIVDHWYYYKAAF